MAMSENSKKVISYLQDLGDKNVTAPDVAGALGLSTQAVNGIFTSAIQRKKYGERIPVEIELEDGTHKQVKLLKLTEAGRSLNVNDPEL